jgi:hypothetical protein
MGRAGGFGDASMRRHGAFSTAIDGCHSHSIRQPEQSTDIQRVGYTLTHDHQRELSLMILDLIVA